jgi:hypothetical protein
MAAGKSPPIDWPPWWKWELEITSHAERRMEDREFNEVELREMLENAGGFEQDVVEGRFVIHTVHRRAAWHVIVEPDDEEELLVVVTPPTGWGKYSTMRRPYLEVTFRKGKPFAAYLHLPRPSGAKTARSEERGPGLVVDFAPNGEAVGIEITAPALVDRATVNRLLADLGLAGLEVDDLAPLRAA